MLRVQPRRVETVADFHDQLPRDRVLRKVPHGDELASEEGMNTTLSGPRSRRRRFEAVMLSLVIVAVVVATMALAALCVLLIVGFA